MRAAIILLAFLGAALAVPEQSQRIMGGATTTVQQYPFMSNMQYGYYGTIWYQRCGGTLITNTVVVSAAQCFIGYSPSQWRVLLGTSFSSSGGSAHFVSQITLHPDFDPNTYEADVALVRLVQPAILSSSVQTASIAGPNYIPPDGSIVDVLGWGALWYNGVYSELLQHADVNVINQELCVDRYAYLKTQPGYETSPDVTPGMICSGILNVGYKGACQGDSGGPLMHMNVLVGIISWGAGCGDPFYPRVNARVSHYSNWIVANA